jgi:hypothetical protein
VFIHEEDKRTVRCRKLQSALNRVPTHFPSVSMVDRNDGSPSPRFRVLQLLHDNFGPGAKGVESEGGFFSSNPFVYSLPVVTKDGKKRVLLVNKCDRAMKVDIPGASSGEQTYADQTTGSKPPATIKLSSDEVTLNEYSVSAVTLP